MTDDATVGRIEYPKAHLGPTPEAALHEYRGGGISAAVATAQAPRYRTR